jgi:4-hydroxybenzoyl-CoA thioesterase
VSGAVGAPFQYAHRVRFDEVDAAGIVYFARFFTWCHDAMEAMLGALDGGYRALVNERRLGLPAVHVEADYSSPLRFGDDVGIAATVERIGKSSTSLLFHVSRADDGRPVAAVRHVVALVNLGTLRAIPLPDDLRAVLERHHVARSA